MLFGLLFLGVFLLAWGNGANDNFKGVATLWGSGAAGFRGALVWATGATLLGSLLSIVLAQALAVSFSGKGLIPAEAITTPLLAATAAAAAAAILLATLLGMPTSTTHALTGALVGSGIAAIGASSIDWHRLLTGFAQPLLLSPLLALALTGFVYPVLRSLRLWLGLNKESCLCVSEAAPRAVELSSGGAAYLAADGGPGLTVGIGEAHQCAERYSGRLFGIRAQRLVDGLHFASSGAVCFARAVNDTPKIAALLFAASAISGSHLGVGELVGVALVMASGGWVQSRKVAITMSRRITDLNAGQGLTANLVTAALVLGASRLGLPVSTTHVSCGSIFGIGLVNRRGDWRTVAQILVAWVTTLPLGFAFTWLLGRVDL